MQFLRNWLVKNLISFTLKSSCPSSFYFRPTPTLFDCLLIPPPPDLPRPPNPLTAPPSEIAPLRFPFQLLLYFSLCLINPDPSPPTPTTSNRLFPCNPVRLLTSYPSDSDQRLNNKIYSKTKCESWTIEEVRGALVHKRGRKYQHDCLKTISSLTQ